MTATIISIEDAVEIPLNVRSLPDFRTWCFSRDFPDRGRIDFIQGAIEVDMSPEQAFSHGSVKIELIRVLGNFNKQHDVGLLFSDRMRVYQPEAQISVEPDIVLVSHAALETKRVRLTRPTRGGDDFFEITGGPDLVVEIVSQSSVRKDTVRLLKAYYEAGVKEYWIIDARSNSLRFDIMARGTRKFAKRRTDEDGYIRSSVLDQKVRLTRTRMSQGYASYTFRMK